MIEKKLTKLGRSWAVILPPFMLKLLNITPTKDRVDISIEGQKIIIEKKKI